MSERLRIKKIVSPLLIAGLGFVGCAQQTQTTGEVTPTTVEANQSITRTYEYLEDGSRITHFVGNEISTDYANYERPADILEWCDLGTLRAEVLGENGDATGGGLDHIDNYVPCADDKLTASDFAADPASR